MEKIKLYNGTVLEFVEISDTDNSVSIKFDSLEINYLRNLFSNKENLTVVEVLTEGDALCRIYEGYNHPSTKIRYEIEEDYIAVTIYKDGELESRIVELEEQSRVITETVDFILVSQLESEV